MANFATQISFTKTFSIVSNISVILGLIFLVIELRQNNEFMKAQSAYNYYSERGHMMWNWGEESNRILLAKMIKGEELDEVEKNVFGYRLNSMFTLFEYEFFEMLEGRITEEQLNPQLKVIHYQYVYNDFMRETFRNYLRTAPKAMQDYFYTTYGKEGIDLN